MCVDAVCGQRGERTCADTVDEEPHFKHPVSLKKAGDAVSITDGRYLGRRHNDGLASRSNSI